MRPSRWIGTPQNSRSTGSFRTPRGRLCSLLVFGLLVLGSAVSADNTSSAAPLIEIPNAEMPSPGLLVGGQPSAEQLKQAAALGYGTIINLRGEGELADRDESAEAEALGLSYVAIPISGADQLTRRHATALSKALSKAGDKPVMVHCASGNRVGALFALKAFFVDETSTEEAMALGEQHGLRSLAPAVQKVMDEGRP